MVPKVISVEGIIGAGKTTILNKIESFLPHYKIKIIPEPIAAWKNVTNFQPDRFPYIRFKNDDDRDFHLLLQMYRNAYRWGFSFQVDYFICIVNKCYICSKHKCLVINSYGQCIHDLNPLKRY